MKSAKEMFKKLGYRKSRYENTYYKTYKNGKEVFISFDKKKIKKCKCGYGVEIVDDIDITITLSELKAINKQVEELWGGNNA